jgi:hypothetical protein
MPGRNYERPARERELAQAFGNLLAAYADCEGPLSAWECHCLGLAIVFARNGHFDRALRNITEVLEPPIPLPAFADPAPLTVEDARRLVGTFRETM